MGHKRLLGHGCDWFVEDLAKSVLDIAAVPLAARLGL
jgi:hypothetical protein